MKTNAARIFVIRTILFVLFSLYFLIVYSQPNSLPNRTMLSISGAKKQNGVELKGMLSSSHSYDKMIIERSTAQSSSFSYTGEMNISGTSSSTFSFTYFDTKPEYCVNYYRIRLVGSATNIQEISNTIMVKMENDQKDLEVINTIVKGGNTMLSIWSQDDQHADLQFTDMSGRLMISAKTNLNSGLNNIYLSGLNTTKGYCVLIVRTQNNNVNKQILIQ